MRFYLDCEFIEDGKTIDLLSIGVVSADGQTFYAENTSADLSKANDWVKENVLPHMKWIGTDYRGYLPMIAVLGSAEERNIRMELCDEHVTVGPALLAFVTTVADGEAPEFWAYYGDYDWVATCQLFGRMVDLPEGWPMFCLDLKQLAVDLGNPMLPAQDAAIAHNALADAEWNALAHRHLEYLALPEPDRKLLDEIRRQERR